MIEEAIGAGLGLAETVVGLIGSHKAKKEAERLQGLRPKYKESPYYKDALSLAESDLSTGMSADAQKAYEQGIDRDLSTSLNTILQGGGSVNNVAQIFDASQQGRQRLALMKENLRLNQINNVVRAQQLSEEDREKAFQFNEFAPWADRVQANAEARKASQNMIWGGLSTAASSAMSYFGNKEGSKQMGNYFNQGQGGVVDPNLMASTNLPHLAQTSGDFGSPGQNINQINPNYLNL